MSRDDDFVYIYIVINKKKTVCYLDNFNMIPYLKLTDVQQLHNLKASLRKRVFKKNTFQGSESQNGKRHA